MVAASSTTKLADFKDIELGGHAFKVGPNDQTIAATHIHLGSRSHCHCCPGQHIRLELHRRLLGIRWAAVHGPVQELESSL